MHKVNFTVHKLEWHLWIIKRFVILTFIILTFVILTRQDKVRAWLRAWLPYRNQSCIYNILMFLECLKLEQNSNVTKGRGNFRNETLFLTLFVIFNLVKYFWKILLFWPFHLSGFVLVGNKYLNRQNVEQQHIRASC